MWSKKVLNAKLKDAERLIEEQSGAGKIIIERARKMPPARRYSYLVETAYLIDEQRQERKKYIKEKLPVGVREFIESPDYMDKAGIIWPAVMDEIEEACSGKYVEGVFTGGIGPLPGWTEVLTPTGWVRIDEWGGQPIAEYHAGDGTVHMKVPFDYIARPATKWVHVSRPAFDMTLSEEHQVILRGFSGAVITADAMDLHEEARFKRSSYSVPGAFHGGRSGVDITDDQLRVMVAVLADGNFHPHSAGNLCRVTVRKDRKKARLEWLLAKAGIEWDSRCYDGRPTEVTYLFEAPLKTKSYDWAWECSHHQLEVFYDESPHWDGLFSGHEWRFHSTDKGAADFMQYVCHATGRRAALSMKVREGNRQDLYVVSAKTTEGPDYRLSKTTTEVVTPDPGEQEYCFTTSSGFFVVRQNGRVFVTGNCAKSTAALYIQAYFLYVLSRLRRPHEEFGLDPASEIVIIFQSITSSTAKTVEFDRFKEMIEGAPYFQNHFRHDPKLESTLRFPRRIIVKPVSGSETAAIGQNVIGGIIDEVNFMSVVEKSAKKKDGGTYDQAVELYNSIVRRRESRFMQKGSIFGLLCLCSSARYPGQFTDKRKDARDRQLRQDGTSTIFYYDKRQWEIRDPNSKTYPFSGEMFRLFLGDASRKPAIRDIDEEVSPEDEHLHLEIPVEYKHAFEDDIYDAIRDIAGRATLAQHPFIAHPEKVADALGSRLSILSREDCDFQDTKVLIYPKRIVDREQPRFVHIDLSRSGDSTGLAIGYVKKFTKVERSVDETEVLPVIHYDALLEITVPRAGEIDYGRIRGLLYKLESSGLPIKWVSLDGYNSTDFIQIVRQKGYISGECSMDKTPVPYEILKQAIMDGRIKAPEHEKCQRELVTLERDPSTGKIDHPESSSKDVSDAMAGVAYGLTMQREVWAIHKVKPNQIPMSITRAAQAGKRAVEGQVQD